MKDYFAQFLSWKRKRFWLVIAILAWTVAGFFLAPLLVRNALQDIIEDSGRSIAVTDIEVNPYVLSLQVDGLQIRESDGREVIRFEQLFVNFQVSSLFRWAWTFDEIRLQGLHVEEERYQDGTTRLQRLSGDLAGPPDSPPRDGQNAAPPRLIIHEFVLDQGSIGITDQQAGGYSTTFGPVSVDIQDLRTKRDHAGDQQVSITTPQGGVISWRGNLQLVPLASSGQLTLSGKGLPAALRYANHFLPVRIEGEEVDVALDYRLERREESVVFAAENWRAATGAISVRMDDEEDAFLDLSKISLEGGKLNWPERTVVVESLTLDRPRLEAWLTPDGRLSLLDALPQTQSNEGPTAGDEEAAPWNIRVNHINLNEARVGFEDRSLPQPGRFEATDLNLSLSEANNEADARIPVELTLRIASGGEFSFSGNAVVLPEFAVDGKVKVADFALPALQPWIEPRARVELGDGSFSVTADVSAQPPARLEASGTTRLENVDFQDTARGERLAAFSVLDVEKFEFDLAANSLKTSPIKLQGAFGRIHIYEDLTTNLSGLVIDQDIDQGTAEQPDEGNAMSVSLAGVEIEDAGMFFADDSLPLPFRVRMQGLDGELSTLSTGSSEPANVEIAGQVGEFGEARIDGNLNPWDFTQQADIVMSFRNLDMASLTPYTIQYAGYAIDGGRLEMDLGYRLNARKLEGTNKIVIRELVLGDKVETPDGASLPLKLAVALLTDSNGVINVDLPVSGDLDDPTFKISGIFWRALGNLITRAVTAPFRFLGNLVGVDSEDFGTLYFRPGQAELAPPDREQLDKLAQAMRERPELSLVISGVYAEDPDRRALQKQAFEARLDAARTTLIESGSADLIGAERAALESLFASTFPSDSLEAIQNRHSETVAGDSDTAEQGIVLDEPAYLAELKQRLIEAEALAPAALEVLARARAEAVARVLAPGEDGFAPAVTVGEKIEAVTAEDGVIKLELEVAVDD